MIIVASVSCIYGLCNPVDYQNMVVSLRPGMIKDRDEVMAKLIEIQYDRNDMDFHRGTLRVRGPFSTKTAVSAQTSPAQRRSLLLPR